MHEFTLDQHTKTMLNHGDNLYRLRAAILQDCDAIMAAYNANDDGYSNHSNAAHVKEDIEQRRTGVVMRWMTTFVDRDFYMCKEDDDLELYEKSRHFNFARTKVVFDHIMRFDLVGMDVE